MKACLIELPAATPEGVFLARYTENGLAKLDFPTANRAWKIAASGRPTPQILRWHRVTTAALLRVLTGRVPRNLPPMDWTGTTDFQQSVWRQMLKLGPGQTLSYGEIAAAIGKPRAVRAVGGACGANPIPVLVPCHRVLAAHGRLGGFSGGLDWKRRLLAREGLEF